jgi:anti-sigma factor RsiW
MRGRIVRPRTAWAAMATLALSLALVMNLAWQRWALPEAVRAEVLASHVRATLGQHLVDVASSDQHTVKPWLSARLDFSPPVSDLQRPGAVFLGGRVDYINGRPVAALVYQQRAHVVSSYLWPTQAADQPAHFSQERGFRMARWSRDGMQRWVVADLGRDEFAAVVDALQAADANR